MTSLQELLDAKIEIEIEGVKFPAKRATLNDLIEIQNYTKKLEEAKDPAKDTKQMIYSLYLCLKKADPSMTLEICNKLPLTFIGDMGDIMVKLGFTKPPKAEAKSQIENKPIIGKK